MLDAIISPEWDYRYYSFDGTSVPGEAMASMRNGSGDEYAIFFTPAGAILKGFAHEAPMSPYANKERSVWPGVLDEVPEAFVDSVAQGEFSAEETTFCVWRPYGDPVWQRGDIEFPEGEDPDGSADLLGILDGNARTYQAWAEYYYERPISPTMVQHIYEHRPLTQEVITALNPDLLLEELAADIEEIGYQA
ncbi:MAG: hypothetical protein ACJ78Q_19390 [Chloroflexia bacterium]